MTHFFVDCMVARSDRVKGKCIIGKMSQNEHTNNNAEKKTFMIKETVDNKLAVVDNKLNVNSK